MTTNISLGESPQDYEVFEVLGKGGFAQVYRARCRLTGTMVALKKIDKALMASKGMESRVRQEVLIHSRIKHPAVLELYTFFEDKHYVYLVLELAHNGELARYFRHEPKGLSEVTAANILRQIVDGVLYLHSHRIIHRDLSLNNLLLTQDLQVKIADFGLATQLNEPDEKHMTMCGTPNYISPEVASRSNHGLPADIWGIGCLLYTLLVGKPPFDTQQVKQTLNRVIRADYQLPDGLSVEAQDLLKKMLRKNPSERISLYDIIKHPFLHKSIHTMSQGDSGFHTTVHTMNSTRCRRRSEEQSTASCDIFRDRQNSMDKLLSDCSKKPASFNVLVNNQNYTNRYDTNSATSSLSRNFEEKYDCLKQNSQLKHVNNSNQLDDIFMKKNYYENEKNDDHYEGFHNSNYEKDRYYNNKENYVSTSVSVTRTIGVPPLCTDRLSEILHRTRNAELSISTDGTVNIKFIKRRGRSREARITETISISKDGIQIIIYSVNDGKGVPLSSPLLSFTSNTQERFTYHNLPEKYWKKYLFAAHFVDMIKAQTPKVTIYSDKAKCHLMEKRSDFEAKFYDGNKITLKADDGIKIVDNEGHVCYNLNSMNEKQQELYNYFQKLMKNCLDIETALENVTNTSNVDFRFPVIVGRRPQDASAKMNNQISSQITPAMSDTNSINIGSFRHSASNSNFDNSVKGFSQQKIFNPSGDMFKIIK